MNKTYTSKWNAALGAWVACSEITRRAGKATAAVVVLAAAGIGPAWAAITCAPTADGSYLAGWTAAPTPTQCNSIPATTATLGTNASWYILTRSSYNSADPQYNNVTVGATNISYSGTNGFAVLGNQYQYGGSISFSDLTAKIVQPSASGGGGISGLGTHDAVPLTGDNFNLTSDAKYSGGNSGGGVESYGIVAGSSVISGEGGSSQANNGKFSTVTINSNATIKQNTSGGLLVPILNTGLRAIQGAYQNAGNGSSGKIEIKGTLDMTLTGARIEGIYVSGAASDSSGTEAVSQVILNDSSIKMVKSGATVDSSAIKIGKTRAVGTGKGLLVSNGALTIVMDPAFGGGQAYMSPAIKMAVSGSQLLANGANSSADITASRSALAIGIDDWGSNVDSGGALGPGIQALFAKATVKTQSATAPLLLVDSGQQDVQILFDNASNLTAASNGYLIDIIKYRSSTAASSVQLTLDNASVANGLSNQNYASSTLNVDLGHASIWNLVEKSNGDKTSTYTSFDMKAASTLNAFKGGAAAFVMNGPLSSDASTTNLVDNEPNDVLTVQPSYAGSNGAVLAVDTCLAGSGADSDKLVVNGDTSGATVLKVTPFNNPACPGADTTTTGDGKGILVVQVTGSSNAVFTLDGGTVTQGNYDYKLVKVGNDWYLQSQSNIGTITVKKQVDAPAGAPAFSGSIPFTLSCTTPSLSQDGSIAVSANQGSADPITVAAGSSCSVTEGALPAAPAGYHWGSTTLPAAGAPMPPAGTQTLTIVNTLVKDAPKTGQLLVTKTVQVPAGAAAYSGSIDFSVSCTNPVFGTTGSIAVSNNQGSATPITVQAGSQCTVAETLPAAPTGMEWGTPAYTQPGAIAEGQTATATIANKLNKKAAGTATPVPVNAPLALGGLAALIGLAAGLRKRRGQRG